MKLNLHIIFVTSLLLFTADIYSQNIFNGINCGTVNKNVPQFNPGYNSAEPFYGIFKTNRTDTSYNGLTPPDAVFPVIVVFVQFLDDEDYEDWPRNRPPRYIDSVIAPDKRTFPNWWEAYNSESESISSYWSEVSRGKLHVVGKAFSVVLKYPASHYDSMGYVAAEREINSEIWKSLDEQISDWSLYDKWSFTSVLGNIKFLYEKDNTVDMIYKIHKSVGRCLANYNGYSQLAFQDLNATGHFILQDSIKIYYGWGCAGSGLTVSRLHGKYDIIGTIGHEHGHYLFAAGHIVHGKMVYVCGFDYFYSPYEMIYNGYMKPRYGSYGNNQSLGDYSSRNSSEGEILKVRIDSIQRDEYFLIANRRKVSKWDRVMLGDTTMYDVFAESEYGKGIYIYHVFNGIQDINGNPSVPHDLECADGLWQWSFLGNKGIVDLNCWTGYGFALFRRDSVIYENDSVSIGKNTYKGDGVSLNRKITDSASNSYTYTTNMFGVGQRPSNNCLLGTDRLYTNSEEFYTSNENMGDRWDAWNIGYNEMFSPYSSPNTKNRLNNNTGIFIWYHNLVGNTAYLKIFRTSAETPLDSILKWTPPSRPIGLKIEITDCEEGRRYPKLIWNHNMEPDMEQSGMRPIKRYKIFRAWTGMENVPDEYREIADVLIDAHGKYAEFIDYDTYGQCDYGTAEKRFRVRYKIKTVDVYNDSSVYSDFASVSTFYLNRDGVYNKENSVLKYKLEQNFPNPFNPFTNIYYSVPKNCIVNIVIYDVLGRKIKSLINEFKQPGHYIISLNGIDLPSGIYFYKMTAGEFTEVRRMVILK